MDTLIGGRYQIINDLGKGGFGETFVAKDTHLPSQKLIVIKRLHQLNSEQRVSLDILTDLFKKEAEVLEDLGQHCSQMPTLYADFVENERFYLVQEYIEGKSLIDLGIISGDECRRILASLLKTLQYIHGKKIIHRDIKPENIIIRNSDREPVLIDFGAVKETMGTVVLNSQSMVSSVIVGTQGFMPPEQSTGRTVYGSDLFALGLTMIYSLTGKYPSELKSNSFNGELEWQDYVPNIDRSLQNVLEKSTKIDLSKRYGTADEMYQDLYLSTINTVAVVPPRKKDIPLSQNDHRQANRTQSVSRDIPYPQQPEIKSQPIIPQTVNRETPITPQTQSIPENRDSYIRDDYYKPRSNWFSIVFTALLVGLGVSVAFLVTEYIQDTQAELATIEQQKKEMENQLKEQEESLLREKNRRLQAEKLKKEAELEQIKQEELEKAKIEEERKKQEELEKEKEPETEIDVPPVGENPELNPIQSKDAIAVVQKMYNLVSKKRYNQAEKLFADPSLLNPSFFEQFSQVTVTNLQVIEENSEYITLIGTNTYYYLDGSTQAERRDYTLQLIGNNIKIVNSNFIKVTKLRG